MKTYTFEEFIKDNKIKTEELSELLQQRIVGFNDLREDLEHTLGKDREVMESKLENLADELEEDLYDEFEHLLENNSEPESEPDRQTIEDEDRKAKEKEKREKERKEREQREQQRREKLAQKEKEKAEADRIAALNPDEVLLEKLFKQGKKKMGRSELIKAGYKGKLEQKRILVGKYRLSKAFFSYTYVIDQTAA
jgi:hypothetical protein